MSHKIRFFLAHKNNLVLIIISITVILSALLIFVAPLAKFFQFEALNTSQLMISVSTGFLVVIWYEVVKWWKKNKSS